VSPFDALSAWATGSPGAGGLVHDRPAALPRSGQQYQLGRLHRRRSSRGAIVAACEVDGRPPLPPCYQGARLPRQPAPGLALCRPGRRYGSPAAMRSPGRAAGAPGPVSPGPVHPLLVDSWPRIFKGGGRTSSQAFPLGSWVAARGQTHAKGSGGTVGGGVPFHPHQARMRRTREREADGGGRRGWGHSDGHRCGVSELGY
jgi:hypothetical protein